MNAEARNELLGSQRKWRAIVIGQHHVMVSIEVVDEIRPHHDMHDRERRDENQTDAPPQSSVGAIPELVTQRRECANDGKGNHDHQSQLESAQAHRGNLCSAGEELPDRSQSQLDSKRSLNQSPHQHPEEQQIERRKDQRSPQPRAAGSAAANRGAPPAPRRRAAQTGSEIVWRTMRTRADTRNRPGPERASTTTR